MKKKLKIWLDRLFFRFGYVPKIDPTMSINIPATKKEIVIVSCKRRVFSRFAFSDGYDEYIKDQERSMRIEIAERSSELFERVNYGLDIPTFYDSPDFRNAEIELRLNIVKP